MDGFVLGMMWMLIIILVGKCVAVGFEEQARKRIEAEEKRHGMGR